MDHRGQSTRPPRPTDFKIGLFCVLGAEFNAVQAALDECWPDTLYPKPKGDPNAYSMGKMCGHNVVLVFASGMGKVGASSAAVGLRSSFQGIELCLLVGVCGASPIHPTTSDEIMLGDVIISNGIVQTDFGRQFSDGIRAKDTPSDRLSRQPPDIRAHLAKLSSKTALSSLPRDTAVFVREILAQEGFQGSHSPGKANDCLYPPTYRHKHRPPSDCPVCRRCKEAGDKVCEQSMNSSCVELGCSSSSLVRRNRGKQMSAETQPSIHFGVMASSDQVMKSAIHRDSWTNDMGIIGFEMEGAGIWEYIPTIIIKGVCDYADSHKSKKWQSYAGVVAAACSKAFLKTWSPSKSQFPGEDAMEGIVHDRTQECLQALNITDPREYMEEIRVYKDEMLQGTCDWVWNNPDFDNWWQGRGSSIFWLHGDAGKGKTMMMLDLATAIKQRLGSPPGMITYFFCQGAVSSANTATAILRGLIYCLVSEKHSLQNHLIKRLDTSKASLLEGPKALHLLWRTLSEILADPQIPRVYLLVDALDECVDGIDELLKYMTRKDQKLPGKARWIVSSRNEPHLYGALSQHSRQHHISLEANADRVGRAVQKYVRKRVRDLASRWDNQQDLQQYTQDYLTRNANGTFLWVSLVCEELQKADPWDVREYLKRFPPGLTAIYHRMMDMIKSSTRARFCQSLLCAVAIARKRLTLDEACFVAHLPTDKFCTAESIASLAKRCGSFFTVQENSVAFIHQSALDYVIKEGGSAVFPDGRFKAHADITHRSLRLMSNSLHLNMCKLEPGTLATDVEIQQVDAVIRPDVQYACLYWASHLKLARENSQVPFGSEDMGQLFRFFAGLSLCWLEALSLLDNISSATEALEYLTKMPEVMSQNPLWKFITDLQRFLKTFRAGIENAPLQVYQSGLAFAPFESPIFQAYSHIQPHLHSSQRIGQWDTSLHILEGHSDGVTAIAFSPDGSRIASASDDHTIRIWDIQSGLLLNVLEGHTDSVTSIAFSEAYSEVLISGSADMTTIVWNIPDEEAEHILSDEERMDAVLSVAISKEGSLVASADAGSAIMIWKTTSGDLIHTLNGHNEQVTIVKFSPTLNDLLVSGSDDGFVQLWDAKHGQIITGITRETRKDFQNDGTEYDATVDNGPEGNGPEDDGSELSEDDDFKDNDSVNSMEFSRSGLVVAAGFNSGQVKLYDICSIMDDYNAGRVSAWGRVTRRPYHLYEASGSEIYCVAISDARELVAAGGEEKIIRVWNMYPGEIVGTLQGHLGWVKSLVFSQDGEQLVSGSDDGTIRIWNMSNFQLSGILKGHSGHVETLCLSPKGNLLASASPDSTVRLWDSAGAVPLYEHTQTGPKQHRAPIICAELSRDGRRLITGSEDCDVGIWDSATYKCVKLLKGHNGATQCVSISPEGDSGLSGSFDGTAKIWNFKSESCTTLLHGRTVQAVAFLMGGYRVMSASSRSVRIWQRDGTPVFDIDCAIRKATTVSLDGRKVAMVDDEGIARVYDANTGGMIARHKIENGQYDSWDNLMLRAVGWQKSMVAIYEPGGLEMSEDERWITDNGERRLWMPGNVKPICFARCRGFVAIGSAQGQVLFITRSNQGGFNTSSRMELD